MVDGFDVADTVNGMIAEWYQERGIIETEEELEEKQRELSKLISR